MRTLTFAALAAAIVPALYLDPAVAGPLFAPGFNQLYLNDFINLYRTNASCAVSGGCLASDPLNDPAGFRRVDPTVPNNALVGDIVAGIFNVGRIENPVPTTIWAQSPGIDEFTGYFAVSIAAVQPATIDPAGRDHWRFAPPAPDPFGILAPGEILRFYVDDGVGGFNSAFESDGNTYDDIARATDGVFWGTLGSGGYAYVHTGPGGPTTTAFFGLDLITQGPAYNAGVLALINDPGEIEVGGTPGGGGPVCLPADVGSVACDEIVGISNIIPNPAFPATSPWMLKNEASFGLFSVPEPTTLALLGLSLAGLAASRHRKR